MSAEDIIKALEDAEEFTELDERLAKLDRNDVGNARRLLARHGQDLLHVREVGWHVWTGTHWCGETGPIEAVKLAQSTAAAMKGEANALVHAGALPWETDAQFAERITSARKWAVQSGNQNRLSAMVLQASPHRAVRVDDMDADPMLLNVAGGTIQLGPVDGPGDGGVLARPHRREDRITKILPVAWEPEATCPRWLAFLEMIQPDPEVRTFLQRWFGYCLTGRTDEECLLILHGEGANGKSTVVDVILHLLGGFGCTLPIASLLQEDRGRRGADATPDLARLTGMRLVSTGEADASARLAEGTVKLWTGGDRLTARHLNQGFFDFKPEFKLVISTNKRPVVRGQDHGIWRRLILVPFGVRIENPRRKADVMAEFLEELPGILNWLLDGYRMWAERGLAVPDAVRAATTNYRDESDPVGEFLAAAVERRPGVLTSAATLYAAYCRWCRASSITPFKNNGFGRAVSEHGWSRVKVGTYSYQDMALVNSFAGHDAPDEPPPEPGEWMPD